MPHLPHIHLHHDLPPNDAPFLALVQASPAERLATWKLNGEMWAGRLSKEAYLRREEHLAGQAFTRNGGITFWVLVDERKPADQRPILASCETLRKRALIARARPGGAGEVEEIVSHGIGSVFCNPEYRRRGYAKRMLQELAKQLDTWQQPDGRQSDFTVLYSDIGKSFYAQVGWRPFPSSHIVLPAASASADGINRPKTMDVKAEDLAKLCAMDEAEIIKRGLVRESGQAGKTVVALVPDKETLQWHHAREEFFAKETSSLEPVSKGAYIHGRDGTRNWCVWSRYFGDKPSQDTFVVLRLAIEGEDDLHSVDSDIAGSATGQTVSEEKLEEVAALLRAAQGEAAKWSMKEIQLWNPTRTALLAARRIDPSVTLIDRGEDSITSLRWHGNENPQDVVWLGNEKYGWC